MIILCTMCESLDNWFRIIFQMTIRAEHPPIDRQSTDIDCFGKMFVEKFDQRLPIFYENELIGIDYPHIFTIKHVTFQRVIIGSKLRHYSIENLIIDDSFGINSCDLNAKVVFVIQIDLQNHCRKCRIYRHRFDNDNRAILQYIAIHFLLSRRSQFDFRKGYRHSYLPPQKNLGLPEKIPSRNSFEKSHLFSGKNFLRIKNHAPDSRSP